MSTRRGYLETQGDRKRLRFVKEGYDADDPNVPANAVLFDSDSDGMGSVLDSGVVTLPKNGTYSWGSNGFWVKQWNYDFVPFCLFAFDLFPGNSNFGWIDAVLVNTTVGSTTMISDPIIRVSKLGIWFRGSGGGWTGASYLRWTAFRMSAV